MRFIIGQITKERKDGKFGAYTTIQIKTQDGKTIYCNDKPEYTSGWHEGFIVDVLDSWVESKKSAKGHSYLSIKWPSKGSYSPQVQQPTWKDVDNTSIHAKLDEILVKLNRLMSLVPADRNLEQRKFGESFTKNKITYGDGIDDQEPDIEQADHPQDKDFQGY